MKKILKYTIALLSCIFIFSMPIIAMAYDVDTAGDVEITDVHANFSGTITNVSYDDIGQSYALWITPGYTSLMMTFQVNFPEDVSNFKLKIPIDFSYLSNHRILTCHLHSGGDLNTAMAVFNGNYLEITGVNPFNSNFVICELNLAISTSAAKGGYIYFGHYAEASYDVVFDISGELGQLESADSQLDEYLDYDGAEPPEVSPPTESELHELSGFMNNVWTYLHGWQTPIMLSVVLGALGFILALKGGKG